MAVFQEEKLDTMQPVQTSFAVESGIEHWLKGEETDKLRARWSTIQIDFVDEPRKSVKQADALVVEVIEQVKQVFSEKRTVLDGQVANSVDISTEDLRIALQGYRVFLNRLLLL
jgi:hypothetical protein